MANGWVREPTRGDGNRDYTGDRATVSYNGPASSREDAYDKLAEEFGVSRGAVYINDQGQAPDSLCTCQRLSATPLASAPDNGVGLYRVTAEFSRNSIARSNVRAVDNNPVFRIERQTVSEPVDVCYGADGVTLVPIVNTAGSPIKGLTRVRIDRVLVIEWVSWHVSWTAAMNVWCAYEGYCNKDTFAGATQYNLRCHQVDVTPATDIPRPPGETKWPYRIVAQLAFRPSQPYHETTCGGWLDIVPSKGVCELGTDAQGRPALLQIMVPSNTDKSVMVPATEEFFLGADGKRLAPGATPYLIWVAHYPMRNFAGIPEPP